MERGHHWRTRHRTREEGVVAGRGRAGVARDASKSETKPGSKRNFESRQVRVKNIRFARAAADVGKRNRESGTVTGDSRRDALRHRRRRHRDNHHPRRRRRHHRHGSRRRHRHWEDGPHGDALR